MQSLRNLPKIDDILKDIRISYYKDKLPPAGITETIRGVVFELRENLKNEMQNENTKEYTKEELLSKGIELSEKRLYLNHRDAFRRVINGTGIVVHTNLGRSPISAAVLDKVRDNLSGYNNLEYGVKEGKRRNRMNYIEKILTELTGAEAALVVNNNAAAVFLILNTLAQNKEVILSRGEFVEIGDSFRISEIIETSGSIIKAVGTTNSTVISDYEKAINENTSVLLKLHKSNFKILGFTKSVSATELIDLSRESNVPVFEDMGSGIMYDLSKYGLPYERTVQEAVKDGIDIISFSGDKMLGGPQAGIIVGKKKYIDMFKKNQILRCLRFDKISLAILEESLVYYYSEKQITNIPVIGMILMKPEAVREKCESLIKLAGGKEQKNLSLEITKHHAQFGGGSIPMENIDSFAIRLESKKYSPNQLSDIFRSNEIPVVTVVENDSCLLDMRTVFEIDYPVIVDIIKNL